MTERKGDWLQTYTGKAFWPLDPRAEEVCIEDIAHALSNLCRYTGHVHRFYSVAEHCVHVSRHVPWEHSMWGLLHDAAEAYVNDIARPLKRHLDGYADVEAGVMAVIREKFDLPGDEPAEVKLVDNRILLNEKAELMPGMPPRTWGLDDLKPLGCSIYGWNPKEAEMIFLNRYFFLERSL